MTITATPEVTTTMKQFKVNDSVNLFPFDLNDPNSKGRVVEVVEGGYLISNMNMPFMGTLVQAASIHPTG